MEFELNSEDIAVLNEAAKAWRIDMDDDYYREESCGYRSARFLYPDQDLVYDWGRLIDLNLLESDGYGYYRLTELGWKVVNAMSTSPG